MHIILNNIGGQIGINILVAFLTLLIGYLLGSFPTAIIFGKLIFHQDPRDFGSKNAGGTNAGRLWGKKWGLIVIIIDMIKTISPLWICWAILTFVPFNGKPLMVPTADAYNEAIASTYIIQWPMYWLTTIGCICGHCWPVWFGFKGGKGAASFCAIGLGTNWALGSLGFLLYFLVLKIKKYVSLSIIVVSTVTSALAWIWAALIMNKVIPPQFYSFLSYGGLLQIDWFYALNITILCIITIIRHSSNIKRLINGTERKITWMK